MSEPTPEPLATALTSDWRSKAAVFREHAETSVALAYEKCADALEDALSRWEDETVNLTQAAALSGYSADHLGRLVRKGTIPNSGRPRAPRIALRDLPSRATTERVSDVANPVATNQISAAQIVRSVIGEV